MSSYSKSTVVSLNLREADILKGKLFYLGFGVTVHYIFGTEKNKHVEKNIGGCSFFFKSFLLLISPFETKLE